MGNVYRNDKSCSILQLLLKLDLKKMEVAVYLAGAVIFVFSVSHCLPEPNCQCRGQGASLMS